MAVFGIPSVREDDALRAVRAVAEMREKLEILNEELERDHGISIQIRTGVNTGEVVVGADLAEVLATGAPVTVAARLEQTAAPGEIIIGEPTYRLVRDAVEVEEAGLLDLKGKSLAVEAWRLMSVTAEAPGVARRLVSPIVGREAELAALHQALDRAIEGRACQVVTVMAEAGAGKSRLAAEFTTSVEDTATVLHGRCLPYGEGITFWPIAEVVKQLSGIDTQDEVREATAKIEALLVGDPEAATVTDHVAAVIGLADIAYPIQERSGRSASSSSRSRRRIRSWSPSTTSIGVKPPSSTSWNTSGGGAPSTRSSSCALLARNYWKFARVGVVRTRTSIRSGSAHSPRKKATSLSRTWLRAPNLTAACRLASLKSPKATLCSSPRRSCGCSSTRGSSASRTGDETRRRHGLLRENPPTINALLDARLEGIPGGERAVLQRASVMGKLFSWAAVSELSPEEDRPLVGTHLQALVRRALRGPPGASGVRGRGWVRLRSHPDPGRRVPRRPQGHAGEAAPPFRPLAGVEGRGRRRRVRRGHRISLGAVVSVPLRTGTTRGNQ